MPTKTESLRGFLRGLISVTNRFSTPKGAFIQMSNLLMNERGALQTIDGTTIESVLGFGDVNPILALQLYVNPDTFASKILGLVRSDSTHLHLYDFTTNPANGPITLATLGSTEIPSDLNWDHPQMFNYAGSLVITLGAGSSTQLYSEPSSVPTLTPLSHTSQWQRNRTYQVGDIVIPNPDNGFCYQALNLNTFGGGISGPGAGQSGSIQPVWPVPSGTVFDTIHPVVSDNTIIWRLLDKSSFANGVVPLGGAHGISHEGAMWLFGTNPNESANAADGPMSLRQSHLNVTNEWPGIYAAFVGKDDGQRATSIGSFTIAEAGIAPQGGLVLFKDYSTYNVTSNFANPSFSLQPVKTDLGCIAPRSVQFVPALGLARLTHMGVAVYNGVQDQIISEEIRPHILGGFGIDGISSTNADNARSALVSNPPMYVLAIPTQGHVWCNRLLCYDILQKSWTVVDLPFEISSFVQVRVPTDIIGITHFPITYMGSSNGILRSWQNGADSLWDQDSTVPIPWSLTTPEIGAEAAGRLYFRRVTVRMHVPLNRQVSFTPTYGSRQGPTQTKFATSTGPIAFGPSQGGNQGQQTQATYEGDFDVIVRFPQGDTGQSERVSISGTGRATIEAIELDVTPRPRVPLGQPV